MSCSLLAVAAFSGGLNMVLFDSAVKATALSRWRPWPRGF